MNDTPSATVGTVKPRSKIAKSPALMAVGPKNIHSALPVTAEAPRQTAVTSAPRWNGEVEGPAAEGRNRNALGISKPSSASATQRGSRCVRPSHTSIG